MATTKKSETLTITAPDIRTAEFEIEGTAPYVQLKFPKKVAEMMRAKMEAGQQAKKNNKKEARDFDEDYRQALHVSDEGWYGVPAAAFRNALISACRVAGFQMTKAKLSVVAASDGLDAEEAIPLVRIYGEPEMRVDHVRNATGVADLRVRAMWKKWHATLRIQYDHEQFSLTDVTNLLARAGMQVGVGEGRPDSKQSAGLGWGTFRILGEEK